MNAHFGHFVPPVLLSAALAFALQGVFAPAAQAHGDHRFHSHPGQEEPEPAHQPGYGWPGHVPGSTSVYGPSGTVGYSVYGHRDGVSAGLYMPLYLGPAHRTRPAVLYPLRGTATAVPGANYAHDCEDVREYHTGIVIDGVVAPAFGNACLE